MSSSSHRPVDALPPRRIWVDSYLGLPAYAVRAFSRPGERVLDPCAGHGCHTKVALALRRQAIGADIEPAYAKFSPPGATFLATDSRNLPLPSNSIDLVVTSISFFEETYTNHPHSIENRPYHEYLEGIAGIALECKRVLRPGRYFVNIAGATNAPYTKNDKYITAIGSAIPFKGVILALSRSGKALFKRGDKGALLMCFRKAP